jgi:hypothetical protein
MRKNPLHKKLRGFQKAPKARFKLFGTPWKLTPQEFVLYEFAIAITDWDPRHDTYGTFTGSNQDIADVLGWKSDVTVLRLKRSLIKKGLFLPAEDTLLKARGFESWKVRKSTDSQETPINSQIPSSKKQDSSDKSQPKQAQITNYSLGSYKDSIGSFKDTNGLTDEEIKEINEIVKEDIDDIS